MQQTITLPANYSFFPSAMRPAPASEEYEQGTSESRGTDSCAEEMLRFTLLGCGGFLALIGLGLAQGWFI